MPRIIINDELLRSLIANTLPTAKGEAPLFDKLVPFLDSAEAWVSNTFTGNKLFERICTYTFSTPLKRIVANLVMVEAMRRAIPALDIVLTPNGFATVGTQNLVTASKARVDRFVGSMLERRDEYIAELLALLPTTDEWIATRQAEFFGESLFPDFEVLQGLGVPNGSKWDKYLELRSGVIDLEASLAEEWFSFELLAELRFKRLTGTLAAREAFVVSAIRTQIINYLKAGSFNSRRLADIVNYIRQNPADFPAWHNSPVAELFSPPVFRNDKKANGYFF